MIKTIKLRRVNAILPMVLVGNDFGVGQLSETAIYLPRHTHECVSISWILTTTRPRRSVTWQTANHKKFSLRTLHWNATTQTARVVTDMCVCVLCICVCVFCVHVWLRGAIQWSRLNLTWNFDLSQDHFCRKLWHKWRENTESKCWWFSLKITP